MVCHCTTFTHYLLLKITFTTKNIKNNASHLFSPGNLCVIIEYCRFGNLRNFLKERRPTQPPNPPPCEQLNLFHLTSFCLQVAKGLQYLASKKVRFYVFSFLFFFEMKFLNFSLSFCIDSSLYLEYLK